jgi:hypothetical protein
MCTVAPQVHTATHSQLEWMALAPAAAVVVGSQGRCHLSYPGDLPRERGMVVHLQGQGTQRQQALVGCQGSWGRGMALGMAPRDRNTDHQEQVVARMVHQLTTSSSSSSSTRSSSRAQGGMVSRLTTQQQQEAHQQRLADHSSSSSSQQGRGRGTMSGSMTGSEPSNRWGWVQQAATPCLIVYPTAVGVCLLPLPPVCSIPPSQAWVGPAMETHCHGDKQLVGSIFFVQERRGQGWQKHVAPARPWRADHPLFVAQQLRQYLCCVLPPCNSGWRVCAGQECSMTTQTIEAMVSQWLHMQYMWRVGCWSPETPLSGNGFMQQQLAADGRREVSRLQAQDDGLRGRMVPATQSSWQARGCMQLLGSTACRLQGCGDVTQLVTNLPR